MTLVALKTLKSFGPIGNAGRSVFSQALLKQWSPLIKSIARSFAFPGKLEFSDVEQELSVVLWNLAKRVDPEKRPEDFRRLIKTEMSNHAIDLFRFYTAKKRCATVGRCIECKMCGMISSYMEGQIPVCKICGNVGDSEKNTDTMKWQPVRISDVHFESHNEDESDEFDSSRAFFTDMMRDEAEHEPSAVVGGYEAIRRVRDSLSSVDKPVFDLLVNPPPDFVQLLLDYGYAADPTRAPYWIMAEYLNDTEKALRKAHTRVCLVAAKVLGRKDMISLLSRYNLGQIGYRGK